MSKCFSNSLLALGVACALAGYVGDANASEPMRPNWSGVYIGAGVGYGSFINNNTGFDFPRIQVQPQQDTGGDGFLGTAIVGYDHVIAPRILVGIFADYDWTGAEGEWRTRAAGANVSGTYKQDNAWAVGGRVGFLSNPGTLIYLTAGYTEAEFGQVTFKDFLGVNEDRYIPANRFNGWFAGAGLETSLMQNLALRLAVSILRFWPNGPDGIQSSY